MKMFLLEAYNEESSHYAYLANHLIKAFFPLSHFQPLSLFAYKKMDLIKSKLANLFVYFEYLNRLFI